jgi:hypothetical protein
LNDIKTTAVIAAITKEHGMLGFQTFGKSVDIPKFVHFLQHIKSQLPNQKVAVFMNQLAVHRSNIVKAEMERLDFTAIFNTSYSPEHIRLSMSSRLSRTTSAESNLMP